MNDRIAALRSFLDASHSMYHAQHYLVQTLKAEGYTRLMENETWNLVPGGKYYISRGGTAVIAFRVPHQPPRGFMMTASHSDHPGFKVKENFELAGTYTRMAVERYSGTLISTWLDRPLSIAGRVTVETEDGVENRLIDIDKDLLLIPNVAIHMNRQVNDGYQWNPAVDTLPLVGSKEAAGKLEALLEQEAGGKILGHDLFLYPRQKSSVWGVADEYISSTVLDDLECAWGCTQGFLRAEETAAVPVLCVFDSEEVGSDSVQGAASMLLPDVLGRICRSCGWSLEQLLHSSFMVSADNAHALHPNHPELADGNNRPLVGGGVVLKFNASQRYTTDAVSAAIFRKVCAKANVPVQTYYNRADIPGGATLGHISLTHVSVPTADIGLPQLAMHSCYETAGVQDSLYLEEAMACYYSQTLTAGVDGSYTLA